MNSASSQPVVVVVNDDATQLTLLSGLLQRQRMVTQSFAEAESALTYMRDTPPDLIVTDVHMPGIDGWRFCRLLRSPEYAHLNAVPILVVSAIFSGDEPRRIAIDIGADAFMSAPVDGRAFTRLAQELIQNVAQRRPPNVLILDDSPTLAGLLKQTFEAHSYHVTVAHTEEMARDAIQSVSFNLAVLDYMGPAGKGDRLLDVLRVEQPDCVCLMTTDEPDPALALEWMKRGAAAYLRKPFDPEYLLELCARARRENTLLRAFDLLDTRTKALQLSEANYRHLVDLAPDVIYRLTSDGCIASLNPAFEEATGWLRTEFIGKYFADIVHPDDLPLAVSMFEIMRQGKQPPRYPLRVRVRSGAYRIGEFMVRPLLSDSGEFDGVLGIVRDVTDQKELEDMFRFHSMVLQQIEDRVLVTDLSGNILYVNDAETESLGYTQEELIGASIHKLGENPERGATQDEILKASLRDGEWRGEVANRTGDGREIILDCRTKVVHDGDGKAVALCGISTDVTERKQMEQRLRVERDLALALSASKNLQEALLHSLQSALALSGMDGGGIYTVEPQTGGLVLQVHHGLSEKFILAVRQMDRETPQVRLVMAGKACYSELPMNEACVTEGLKAIGVIPLRHGDTVIGCLNVASRHLVGIPTHARVSLEALAGRIGHAIIVEQAREALRKSDDAYRLLFEGMMEGFALHEIICDESGNPVDYRYLAINPAFERMVGLRKEEVVGRTVREILPETEQHWIDVFGQVALTGEPTKFNNYSSAIEKHFEVTAFSPEPRHFACIFQEITAQVKAQEKEKRLREQLNQTQKLESIGRLAGGVAHDFNNMLGVILGHAEMALDQLDGTHEAHADLVEIRKAAERSANLTRQLLAFARQQTMSPRVLDLNATVSDMHKMLKRLIGEEIDLVWSPDPGLWPVKMDPSQVDQVLANLCVNARDAIEEVGTVTLETLNCALDETFCLEHAEADPRPGDYVRLRVTDTGMGMDRETLSRVFDPFFTTKEMGMGTGLGLSTVYGILRQNDGFVTVQSQPGQGTTFDLYIPRYRGAAERKDAMRSEGALQGGRETILVVEDEEAILDLVASMLGRLGYHVLKAVTPGEAIDLAERHIGDIDLLLTDVIMPEMNGRALAKNIQMLYPDIQCLFMSGYTADVIVRHGVLDPGVRFIQKPVSMKKLADTIRNVLTDDHG